MNKAIAQEDTYGCGLACVAFITGNNYKETKNKNFKNKKTARTFGYLCKDLVQALVRAGRQYGYKYLKRNIGLSNNTIVFIKRSKRYPAGHYLVKTTKGWMDPWINFNVKKIDIRKAKAGFRAKLPGKPIYAIFPTSDLSNAEEAAAKKTLNELEVLVKKHPKPSKTGFALQSIREDRYATH